LIDTVIEDMVTDNDNIWIYKRKTKIHGTLATTS